MPEPTEKYPLKRPTLSVDEVRKVLSKAKTDAEVVVLIRRLLDEADSRARRIYSEVDAHDRG